MGSIPLLLALGAAGRGEAEALVRVERGSGKMPTDSREKPRCTTPAAAAAAK